MKPSGMVSIRVMSMPWPWAQRTISGNFLLIAVFQRHGIDLDAEPASLAAAMPSSTRPSFVAAGDAGEGGAVQTVERDIDPLDAGTASSSANSPSRTPLVVRVSSSNSPLARWRDSARTRAMKPRRISGSPPVSRKCLTPRCTKDGAEPVEFVERQKIGLGHKRHMLAHAVGAAQVAAVGDRDAHIIDGTAEGIDQFGFLGHALTISENNA